MEQSKDTTSRRHSVGGVLAATLALVSAACSSGGPSDNSDADSAITTDAPAGTAISTQDAPSSADTSRSPSTSTSSTTMVTRPDDPDDPTNVVVVMTDDQTVEQMRWLPTVSDYMSQGIEFSNSLTNYPLCGPSRATFLTGQHATNHGLDCNSGLAARFRRSETNSLGPWLQDAGVHTIHVGKYLNGYGGQPETRYVPAGWDDWRSLAGAAAYRYENFDMVLNGEFVEYGRNDPAYSTDILDEHFDEALRAAPADQPFFAVFTPLAPHYEGDKPFAVPAPRHDGRVTDVLRPPNYDSCATRDSCPVEGGALNRPILTEEQILEIDNGYQTASESLFAVDEAFARMLATLTELSELDNTVIVFTSDNGFFYGEHGIAKGKILPGREALFVPLYIRGPGFDDARVEKAPVSNIDLAPTIADVLGASAGIDMDGQSLLQPLDPDRALLIQAAKAEPGGGYFGVYANGWLFYDWNGLERNELYIADDLWQLDSLDDDPEWDEVERSLLALTEQLTACAGASCAVAWTGPGDATPALDPAEDDTGDDALITSEGSGPAPTVTARVGPGSIAIEWEPVDNAQGYRYRVSEDNGQPSAWIRAELVTELTLSELDPSIEYTVEVSARRGDQWRRSTIISASPTTS